MSGNSQMSGSLAVADYVVFALMLVVSTAVGLYYAYASRSQRSSRDFLTGGRKLTALPVSLSLAVSFLSSITILSNPAEVYRYGANFILFGVGFVLSIVIASEFYLPVFYRLGYTSSYEYLELRFNKATRLVGTVLFIFQIMPFTGVVIYGPALTLSQVTDMDLWSGILSTGVVCTLYCTLGGLKAVVLTDVIQLGIMLVGYVSVIIISVNFQGGVHNIISDAQQGGRLNAVDFDLNPLKRHTFWTMVVGGTLGWSTVYAVNQAQVQRYVSCKSITHARLALFINLFFLCFFLVCSVSAGICLYSLYKNCDPLTAGLISAYDELMPYLVMDIMTSYPGLPGLFFAAVWSGSLSTVSSSINALAAVTLEDLIKPYTNMSEKHLFWISKGLSLLYGILCISMAGLASVMGGMMQAAIMINGAVGGPVLGLFTLGILCPFANSVGGLSGLVSGLVATFTLTIGHVLYPPPPSMTLPLPLTTEGCNSTSWMSTALPTELSTTTASTVQSSNGDHLLAGNWQSPSYLYTSTIGTLTVITVGLIVSLLTGGLRTKVESKFTLMKEDTTSYHIFTFFKNKGRKLNKAQKAKLQQEQEERRLQEEEEARLQAEREERERLERERREKELERLESKDQERREDELNELRHLLEENHTAVIKWKNDAVEKAKWERYMRCDGTPDPAEVREINAFISLWRDDPEANITRVLEQCNLALQLTGELEVLLRSVTNPQEGQKYKEALIELQELIHSKHNLTSEEILERASANTDTETGNMQTVIKDDNITLCLWANLTKNPRFKGLNFEEAGLGFELPKQLAVSDIAVRILHTRYDHLSLLARTAHSVTQTPSQRSLAGIEEAPADTDAPGQVETKGEGEEVNEMQQQKEAEEVRSIEGSEGRKSASSLQSRVNSAQPQHAEEGESQVQTQIEVFDAEGDMTSPPLQLTVMDHIVRVVDLMQYTPLGGVFYYDVFYLPPQACHVNGWEIRQVLDEGLQVFPYPEEKSDLGDNEGLNCPPVGLSLTLPDSVVFFKTPQVARWDAAGEQWRMDGITDVSYEEAEAKISFKMDSFQAFVLMQEIYANFPFQSWELRPLGQDLALFTINGALMDLSIMIKDNQCMLQSEKERGLSHLIGRWMSCPDLQVAMLNAGINVFVNEFTDKYVSSCGKDPLTEHAAYEQMALFASACAFSWSKWNAKCGAEHLVMQVCEHQGPDPVPADSWSLYLLGAQRSLKLEITEGSETFSPDYYPGSEFHSTFIHMLQDNMSTDGIARTRESNYLFVDTVQSLLCATRPLMYS